MAGWLAGWLAGWQPIVYSKIAAQLLKAAWCLLRIATPCAVLRRLTEVAGRPAAELLDVQKLQHPCWEVDLDPSSCSLIATSGAAACSAAGT